MLCIVERQLHVRRVHQTTPIVRLVQAGMTALNLAYCSMQSFAERARRPEESIQQALALRLCSSTETARLSLGRDSGSQDKTSRGTDSGLLERI